VRLACALEKDRLPPRRAGAHAAWVKSSDAGAAMLA
jgi:hypothetical protein